jgi:phage baseplate assembly protein W
MSYDLKIINGDLLLDDDGEISIIFGNEKIFQEIKKILLTDIGENKFHPYYGSRAGFLQVGSIADESFVASEIERSVKESLTNLIRLKDYQSSYQTLNPSEVILTIDEVAVERDNLDPRMWSIFISITTQALDTVNTVVRVKI